MNKSYTVQMCQCMKHSTTDLLSLLLIERALIFHYFHCIIGVIIVCDDGW